MILKFRDILLFGNKYYETIIRGASNFLEAPL